MRTMIELQIDRSYNEYNRVGRSGYIEHWQSLGRYFPEDPPSFGWDVLCRDAGIREQGNARVVEIMHCPGDMYHDGQVVNVVYEHFYYPEDDMAFFPRIPSAFEESGLKVNWQKEGF